MKTPSTLLDRPARVAAVVGAVVAVSATALMAVAAGTAAAAEPGRCADNVNVRAEPDITSEIVALCERGTAVEVGETRNGFVQLIDLGGWAAQEFVSVDGAAPAAPVVRPTTTVGNDGTSTTAPTTTARSRTTSTTAPTTRPTSTRPGVDDEDEDEETTPTAEAPEADDEGDTAEAGGAGAPERSPVGGILG